MLPKMSAYRRDFDKIRYILFLIKDDELLKNTTKSEIKSATAWKNGFDSESVYTWKYLKTKIKSY